MSKSMRELVLESVGNPGQKGVHSSEVMDRVLKIRPGSNMDNIWSTLKELVGSGDVERRYIEDYGWHFTYRLAVK